MEDLTLEKRQLCDIQGRLFELALKTGLDCPSFIKSFMNSKTAAALDDVYDRLQWAGEEYILDELNDEVKGLKEAGTIYSSEIMYWIGYTYRYWHYYTSEYSHEIYKIADAKTMSECWLGFHTFDVKMAIDDLKEIYKQKEYSAGEHVGTNVGINVGINVGTKEEIIMKYLVIGAGGTGGSIGAYMTEAGKDVTLIARGAHLKKMQEEGLKMETTKKGNYTVDPIKATDMDHYDEQPDVIFVCVKGYSLEETIPFIKRVAKPETAVIPILNIYGTGGRMQEKLPGILVTDGCIYIAAEIKEPGTIWQNGDIFRVVYGVRKKEELCPALFEVAKDLKESGIDGVLSENIQRDALQKFAYVSPMAACGLYYHVSAGEVQITGEPRDTFVKLMKEIDALAEAMGVPFLVDIVITNLQILDSLSPTASTSMQRDIYAGKPSEIDGLIYEVVRMGEHYGVPVPTYRMIADWAMKEEFR